MGEENRDNVERRATQSIMLTGYRIFTGVMAVLLLGVVSWMALNVADIPLIKLKIEDLNSKFDERAARLETEMATTSKWQTDKLNDHEIRIRALETQKK